jgi:hypothetical protein
MAEDQRIFVIVPMAPGHPVDPAMSHFSSLRAHVADTLKHLDPARENFPGETACRFEQYINSVECLLANLDKFGNIIDLSGGITHPVLAQHALMVFGPEMAKDIAMPLEFLKPASIRWQDITPKKSGGLSPFYNDFVQKEEGKDFLDRLRKRVAERRAEGFTNIVTMVHALYDTVDELVNDETMLAKLLAVKDFHPNAQELRDNPYLKNVIGPTFNDIVWVAFRLYWETYESLPENHLILFNKIVEQLDVDIDNGSVIPTIGLNGQPIYRRGAGHLQDKLALGALVMIFQAKEKLSIGRPATLEGLSEEKRKQFAGVLELMDRRAKWLGM